MRGGKHYSPTNAHDILSHPPSSGRHSWTKYTQIGSGNLNSIQIFKKMSIF